MLAVVGQELQPKRPLLACVVDDLDWYGPSVRPFTPGMVQPSRLAKEEVGGPQCTHDCRITDHHLHQVSSESVPVNGRFGAGVKAGRRPPGVYQPKRPLMTREHAEAAISLPSCHQGHCADTTPQKAEAAAARPNAP